MEKFNAWLDKTWTKVKTFMLKKWQGVPMYVWVLLLPLLLISICYYFVASSPKKTRV